MTEDIFQILQIKFGLSEFRSGQEKIIQSILDGKECLVIMPTGGGKSLCYQLPALMLDGVTIVVSPLIALMKDQVDALQRLKVPATFINSTLSLDQSQQRIEGVRRGDYKLLYIAPERFYSAQFMKLLSHISVSLFAIDEAHCISQWGHDFRPSYLKMKKIIEMIGNPTVAAFTATATKEVRDDILVQLGIEDAEVVVTGFDRPNLKYFALEVDDEDKKSELLRIIKSIKGSGIIYVSTKKNVLTISELLNENGISAIGYHGGLDKEIRHSAQRQWLENDVEVVVATNAFGMGIDKHDVRFVMHYNMPGSMEAYYQEAGRAGRDGKTAYCVLFFNYRDHKIQEFFIENNYPPENVLKDIYEFLFSLERTEIYLTYREIGEACGVNEMMVAAAVKLFEHHQILQRMNKQTVTFQVNFLMDVEQAIKKVSRAPLQKKMMEFLQLRDFENIPLERALNDLEFSREQFGNVMRELSEKEILLYIPPFRGRGIVLTSKKVAWQDIGIDFKIYQKRLARQFERLEELENYIQRRQCRRKYILGYFGEKYHAHNCKGCDICLDWKPAVQTGSKVAHSSDAMDLICDCISVYNGLYGVTTFAEFLTGSNVARFKKMGMAGDHYFGILSRLDTKKVMRMIFVLIKEGRLSKSSGDYPVLSVNAQHKKQPGRIQTKQKAASEKPTASNYNRELFKRLKKERLKLAGDLPAFMVCGEKVLQQLATYLPASADELLRIDGMGPKRVEQFGSAFLDIIAGFAEEKPDAVKTKPELTAKKSKKKKSKERKLGDSTITSYVYFMEGLSIAQIARKREITKDRVVTHLCKAAKSGNALNIDREVSPEKQKEIIAVAHKVGASRLNPIKAALPESFTYEEIKLTLAVHSFDAAD